MGKPKIRFKGYTTDWEQRKLGDITAKIGSGKTPSGGKSAYVETGIPLIRSQNVNGDKVDFADIVYIDESTDESMANSRVCTNDVLLNITGASIGRSAVYKGLELANVNQHVCIIRPIKEYLSDFIQLNLSSDNGQKQIDASQAGGGREGLNFQEIGKMQFSFPTINEQKCIGRYFNNLDHLITLHQRKYEEMKTLKKYMLQKMFPQSEQKVPEIRFAGFTEDWEQRKLGDLVDRVTRKNQDLVSELPLTISAQYGLIDQNEFFDKRVASKDVSGYYLIENGEFAYNKSTSTDAPWGTIKRLDRYENGVLSTLYVVFRIKENNPVDSDFLVSYYSTNLWHKGIHEIAAEGARNHGLLNIAPADFFETELMISQDIEEQKKIGKYFEELERLITLHQQKCEELKNIKKFMLQNMFV